MFKQEIKIVIKDVGDGQISMHCDSVPVNNLLAGQRAGLALSEYLTGAEQMAFIMIGAGFKYAKANVVRNASNVDGAG